MNTRIFQIQDIMIARISVIARDYEDAVQLLSEGFARGMGRRPAEADFEIVRWNVRPNSPQEALLEWTEQGRRGFVWSIDGDKSWELFEPKTLD